MTDKKYQIFVSSTFRDLMDERQDAIRDILDIKHIPAGMELFPATDKDQLEYIKKVIDECDYYLLIMGGRYGSTDDDGISYTEREYDYAVQTGKSVIAFVHNDPLSIPVGKSEIDPSARESMERFKSKVMTGRLVRTWSTRQELASLVVKSLFHAFSDMPQVGWIRGDSAASTELLEQSNKLLQENARLRAEIAELTEDKPPLYGNLADLDDRFVIRYETPTHRQSGPSYLSTSNELTWRQIFIGIGSKLDKSKTDTCIKDGVKEALEDAGKSKLSFLNDLDKVQIKVQLIALGLITAKISKTTSGTVAEFISLSPKGRSLFYENMVVKKAT